MMKGNFFDTCADITDSKSGQIVARIDRKLFNARDLFGGQQTYVVSVAQGVDLALMVAMCICLDERRNESSG
jgi:alkaline phosphatase D